MVVDDVLPAYGDGALLREAVRSVLAQDVPHWRLTVVDDRADAPPDDLGAWLDALGDPRVRYLANPVRLGINRNFQRCLELATAPLVVVLGADDRMLPHYVRVVSEAAARHPDAAWIHPGVRVIVNSGVGRAFQTGLDVRQLARDPAALREQSRRTKRAELRLTAWHNAVSKPVIAAVNGVCAGGGFHFVADADVVIAAADAQFTDPHVSIGQVVAIEAIGLLRKMPFEPVMRMALTGRHERMSAERAYQLGMVSQLVEPERLRDAAQELGELIARNSPVAMAATKRALWGALETGLTEACRRGAKDLVSVWGHPDQTEGPAAWAGKREPRWAPLTTDNV